MAADKKTRKSARTGSAASLRASSEARWLAAERDTHHMLAMLDAWEESGGMGERAWQYAQMARVYFKKLRNGRVLSSADFDITVLLATAVQRALQAEPAVLEKSADLQSAAAACERIQSANIALRQPR